MQEKNPDKFSNAVIVSLFFEEQKIRAVMVPVSSAFSRSPPEDFIPTWELPTCKTSSSSSLSAGTACMGRSLLSLGVWAVSGNRDYLAQRREDSEEALPPILAYLNVCHEKITLIYLLRLHRVEGI